MSVYKCYSECCAGAGEGIFVPSRRRFLTAAVAATAGAAGVLSAPSVRAAPQGAVYQDFWKKPRVLRVYRSQTGERGTFEYWRDGKVQLQAWYGLLHLLRDVQQDAAMHYDPSVVDVVWAVQEWVRLDMGQSLSFRLTSGGRLLETNRKTKGAATNSLHVHGRAIDGRLEGLSLKTYAQAALFFGMGGVGLYNTHVHVDSGEVRQWGI